MEDISRSSSYRTVPELQTDSESSESTLGSRPPSVEYETTTTQGQATALVFEQPTLVNFVPTSEIQTAVSINADRIVIDTILPPTASLARSPLRATHSTSPLTPPGIEERTQILEKHKEELYKHLATRLTPNYDPTGTIRNDVFKTLTELTRFPDPIGQNPTGGEQSCPCICCELGCTDPLEPHTQVVPSSSSSKSSPGVETELHSFLEMDKPRLGRPIRSLSFRALSSSSSRDADKPNRSFWAFGRSGRSRSHVELSQHAATPSTSSVEYPQPQMREAARIEVGRSRSLSDLVRRRRNKHAAAAPAPPLRPASTDTNPPQLPTRSSSQLELRSRSETPMQAPKPPPRRSSKRYAIITRKPVPPLTLAPQGDARLPPTLVRSGTGTYAIGRIVEEDEEDDLVARRQSALMSSFHPHSEPWSQPLGSPGATSHVGVAI